MFLRRIIRCRMLPRLSFASFAETRPPAIDELVEAADNEVLGAAPALGGRFHCRHRLGRSETCLEIATRRARRCMRARGELEQTPESIEVWASQLATRFGRQPIAVALAQSRGAVAFVTGSPRFDPHRMIVLRLTKYRHLHLFPVHPSTLAHFRQTMVPSGAKSDPGDTACCWSCWASPR